MQSPSQYFQPGDKIRVVHMLAGYSGSRMDPDDSLYLGAYRFNIRISFFTGKGFTFRYIYGFKF